MQRRCSREKKHVPHLWETDLLFRTVLKLQRREFYSQGSPYRPSKNRSTGTAIRSASWSGIAGVGDAHLDILAQIAEAMLDEEVSANIADYDADKIYKVLTGKE